jgi:hypothetical protein
MNQHENLQGNKKLENQPIFVPDYDLYESYFGDFREEMNEKNDEGYHQTDEYDNYGDLVLFI